MGAFSTLVPYRQQQPRQQIARQPLAVALVRICAAAASQGSGAPGRPLGRSYLATTRRAAESSGSIRSRTVAEQRK